MKPPDDAASRYASLRRQLCEAFMDEDVDGWLEAKENLTRLLRANGVRAPVRGRPRREASKGKDSA